MMAVPEDRDRQRLDNFLMAQLPGVPRSAVYKLIRTGQVRVDGKRAKPFQKLNAGEQVRIPPVRLQERTVPRVPDAVIEQLEKSLLFEDENMLVCNKPAGLAVHGGSGLDWGLIEALRQSRSSEQLDLVHRLDRETSGILLVAKNGKALRALQARFAQRETEKRYLTLLQGRLPGDKWTVDEPLLKQEHHGERFMIVHPSGKPSVTRFLRLENLGPATFAEAIPVTGRTHQIRAHAVFLGAPCAGDARYLDDDSLRKWRRRGLERLFLHAHSLAFDDVHGTPQHFSCPLPDELRLTMDRL
ncbi:MAG: RluA family pseudouridine synthase [Xanthomonadales bacterium]|nr:RluA family pseudouridine synthase [Xanthomonadales bacterium]